jgi:hypothetical protein
MAKSKKNPKSVNSSVNFGTPPYGVHPLLPFIPKHFKHAWECASHKSHLVNTLRDSGYKVTATDIKTGHDFLMCPVPNGVDCIITNPPFALATEFLARAYTLGMPFAMLLPIQKLGTRDRQRLFDKYGVEMLFLGGRIDFYTPSGKDSNSWLEACWFTWQFNLPKPMTFTTMNKPPKIRKKRKDSGQARTPTKPKPKHLTLFDAL